MQDSGPRGFARFSPDVINLVGWVVLVRGIGGILERVTRAFASGPMLHPGPHGFRDWAQALGVSGIGLLASVGAIVAAGGLLRRRRWSINLLLVLQVLSLLMGLGTAATAIWMMGRPIPGLTAVQEAAYTGQDLMNLIGGVATVAVELLIIRWLWRFRRELKPSPPVAAEV